MTTLLLTLALLAGRPDAFAVQTELQGLYDEISQATLSFVTPADVDLFHDVLYTPDFAIEDADGHALAWPQVRERAIEALSAPPLDWLMQPIERMSLTADGASVIVHVTTIRTIVDADERYGRTGETHTVTETTIYRDTWRHTADHWRLASRRQLEPPVDAIDKPQWTT